MTHRDDVPVHHDHEPQSTDPEATSQTPPSAVAMADDVSTDSAVDRHDEQPYFLIDSGEASEDPAVGENAEPPAIEAAVESEDSSIATPEAVAPDTGSDAPAQAGFAFAEETAEPAESAPDGADELPEDLQAVNELLDRPTAEIMAISAEDAAGGALAADAVATDATPADATAAAADDADTQSAADLEAQANSLDDIAPGTVAEPEPGADAAAPEPAEAGVAADAEIAAAVADEILPEGVRTKVSWWPFAGYMVAWLGAAGYAVWQLQQLPVGQAAYESDFYSQTMLGGLVLLGMGPVLLLVVWLASWIGHKGARIGSMFISALIKGATATLFGAIVWMGALLLIDYLRLGRPF